MVPTQRSRRRGLAARATACLIAATALGGTRNGRALELDWEDLATRPALTGDWGGARGWLADRGLELEIVYLADVISNLDGGVKRGTVYLGNLDMLLTVQTVDLFDFDAGTFFVYGLANQGDSPSSLVGDAQGVDNIEAPQTAKLYEAWWQKVMLDDRVSVLFGLYDLNSEFDLVESSRLFLNSSFGIGPEFALSGANGPSIFPTTSLGVRLKTEPLPGVFAQVAIVDGVAGDPDDAGGTQIGFDGDEGLLVVGEIAWIVAGDEPGPMPQDAMSMTRTRRRRVGRGWGGMPYALKIGVGAWGYTQPQPVADAVATDGGPEKEQSHPGAYVLADFDASDWDLLGDRGLGLFVRLGFADGGVQQFGGYAGGGVSVRGPFRWRGNDLAGFGVAAAIAGSGFRDASTAAGMPPAGAEVALEWTYRARLTEWFSLQPDLQYVIHPNSLRERPNALVFGLRTEVSF